MEHHEALEHAHIGAESQRCHEMQEQTARYTVVATLIEDQCMEQLSD